MEGVSSEFKVWAVGQFIILQAVLGLDFKFAAAWQAAYPEEVGGVFH